jgi:hypothetical protein
MKSLQISRPVLTSGCSAVGSLAGYYFAKANNRDKAPSMLIGGLIGTITAELIYAKSK